MDWPLIAYALACVVVPIAWGLIVVFVSNRLDRRFLGQGSRGRGDRKPVPIEYHI
jgi:hypothetical protein